MERRLLWSHCDLRAPGRCGWFQLYDCHHILLIKLLLFGLLAELQTGAAKHYLLGTTKLVAACVSPNKSSALFHFLALQCDLKWCGWDAQKVQDTGRVVRTNWSPLNWKSKIQIFKHWEPYLLRVGAEFQAMDFDCLRAASIGIALRKWNERVPSQENGEINIRI